MDGKHQVAMKHQTDSALKRICLVGLLLLMVAATPVFALGLQEMHVTSRLNQPFRASIALTAAADVNLVNLNIQLASFEQFERAGLQRITGDTLSKLEFLPKHQQDGQIIIEVSTKERVTDPILDFILEVEHNKTRVIRQYTAILAPPGR